MSFRRRAETAPATTTASTATAPRPGPRFLVAMAVVVPAVVVTAASCSVESVLPAPSCTDGGSAILAAQSVPTAEAVPCFDPLPAGWDITSTSIDQDGTVIRFDSDRAGPGAAVFHYTESCEIGDAVSAPSAYDDADQYELVERVEPALRARRFHVFAGGCMWWEFDFADETPSALSIELGDRLRTVSRDELNRGIREYFLDEEV